jgi:hypothetical protein
MNQPIGRCASGSIALPADLAASSVSGTSGSEAHRRCGCWQAASAGHETPCRRGLEVSPCGDFGWSLLAAARRGEWRRQLIGGERENRVVSRGLAARRARVLSAPINSMSASIGRAGSQTASRPTTRRLPLRRAGGPI